MSWVEVRMKPGRHPSELTLRLESTLHHHFQQEPWWPDGYVVRILDGPPLAELEAHDAVDHAVPWDARPDEELYGADWPRVAALFQAGSEIRPGLTDDEAAKLAHCLLNALGLDYKRETHLLGWWYRKRLASPIRRRWQHARGVFRG